MRRLGRNVLAHAAVHRGLVVRDRSHDRECGKHEGNEGFGQLPAHTPARRLVFGGVKCPQYDAVPITTM